MTGSGLPPLAAVRVFEAAARLGSFTRAAAELGMTQAAVSYQIKVLEERVGAPLFLRGPRQVTLTEAGRRLSPAVTAAFDQLRAALGAFRDEADGGVLTVSCMYTFAANWLAPRLGLFGAAHPGLGVRLNTDDRLVDFAREEVDAAIRSGPGGWPGLAAHPLFPVHFAPLCSPDLLARLGPVAAPADLLRWPLLSSDDPWWELWFRRAGVPVPAGLATRQGLRFDSQRMDGTAALAGQGVAILTPALWAEDLAGGRLVQPVPLVADEGRHYWLVYPEARRGSRKIRLFRDWLLEEVRRDRAAEEGA